MILRALSRLTRALQLSLIVLAIFPVSSAKASGFTVTGPQDFYFTYDQPTLVQFRTYAQQYGIDSMLWFYDDQDNLIAYNDDWFGLDSYLEYTVQPGITYRLRTGVCCWDPNAWYGASYTVDSNQELVITPEPTTTTTTTETPTTTTEVQTTTTIEETTTTTEETTTTVVQEETTTTVEETTTTTEPDPTPTTEETWPPTTESTTTTTTSTTTAPRPTVPVTTEKPPTETSTPSSPPLTTPETTPTTPSTSPEPVATPPATATDGDVPASSVDVPPAGTEAPAQPEEPVKEVPTLEEVLQSTDVETASDSELASIIGSKEFNSLDTDKAKEIISNIDFEELSDEEISQVVESLNAATDEVKQYFESEVNVYSGQFDNYVPSGSVVTVGQRRVVVAVSAATFIAAPAPSRRKSNV